ncbi:MarR family transcriptional regulator [Escherichia coli]|nr:MarR family transcriptional regulator [Escherichia coli]
MQFESILNESLNIEYQNLNTFLNKYDLKPEEKVAVYEFHSSMAKKNKTLTITEKKDESYKSIKDGVEYVHLFPKNLKALIKEYGLSTNELLVLTEIMESMLSHGNLLINFSQKRLCELTGINKSTMSKVFKSLKDKKCLIENNENTYMNSVIFMKGLPQKLFIQYRDHFLKSIEYKLSSDEDFEQIFDEKFIETYEKNLEGIKDRKKQLDQKAKDKALKNFQKKVREEENLALFPNEWQELDDAS